ncbi:heparan-alpha-glucosaminide N-acetyltransferase domain-containing protein [Lentzea sp. NPDC004782]|uniref:heparan-alpha-glucosaminide N-acetyltransferase domain-containing protein n=1 Tax=Lentzea sp. NPDC004782 TaxID=3154458 RepID=UPI0033B020B1
MKEPFIEHGRAGPGEGVLAGWRAGPDSRRVGTASEDRDAGAMTVAERSEQKQKPGVARLAGIDLARGLAVFGMFAAHVGPDPSEPGVVGGLMELASGRSSALFATLAGLSLAIISGRQEPATGQAGRQAVAKIVIRAVVLLLLGTAMTMTGTSVVVILAYYGLFFLLALPFTRMRTTGLAIAAAVWAVAGPQLSFVVRAALDRSGWTELIDASDPIRAVGGDGVLQLLFTGSYPAATWMPYVLAGLALGRLDLTALVNRTRLMIIGPVLGVLGYGGSALALLVFGGPDLTSGPWEKVSELTGGTGGVQTGAVSTDSAGWLLVASPHSGTTFEVVGNIGVAITVVVAALAVAERFGRWCRPVTAVGTMSLTVYTLHVVAIGVLGLSAVPGEPLPVLLGFIAGAVAFALVWSRFFRKGPLEFVLAKATAPARRVS